MKVAIFDRNENKVIYVENLVTCKDYAVITSKLEFMANSGRAIRLDQLVDTEQFIIGVEEMKELIMAIDKEYSNIYEELEKLQSDRRERTK